MSRTYQQAVNALQRRQNARIVARFLMLGAMLVVTAWLVFHAVYHFPGLVPDAMHGRVMFLLALGGKALVALLLVYLAVIAMRAMLSPLAAARMLDGRRSEADDLFQNAIELAPQASSSPVAARLLSRADAAAPHADTRADNSALKALLPAFAAVMLAAVVIAALQPAAASETWDFLQMRSLPDVTHKPTVELTPGDAQVLRGADLLVTVVEPELGASHTFFQRRENLWREYAMPQPEHLLQSLDASFDYYVATPWASSDTFHVEVYEEPAVRRLSLVIDNPPHTGLAQERLDDAGGQIRAVEGARVRLAIEANHAIDNAALLFDSGDSLAMNRLGRASFDAGFTVIADGAYRIRLRDHLGAESATAAKSIRVTPDRPPAVRFAWPARDTTLTQNLLAQLAMVASDDFGLLDLTLHWQVNGGDEQTLTLLRHIGAPTVPHEHLFDLREAGLIPGDRVVYWASVRDNNPAPQRAESDRWVLRLPSIEEIYQQIEQSEQQKQADMREALERSRELTEEFEQKRREMMKEEETDWQDRDEIEKMLQRQESLEQNVESMAEEYQKLIETMEQNEALSSETLQKMEKIQELMEEIANEDLQRAMEEMQQALENADQDMLRQAMENMKFNMEEFSRKLDQTIDLLENIKKEQAIEKARQIAEEMQQMQEDLLQKTQNEELSPQELARRQEAINDKLEALKEQTAAADSMLSAEDEAALQEMMDELREMMESDSLRQQMEQAQQNLENGEMQQAAQQQQSASEQMQSMLQMLNQMKQMMSSSSMMNNQEALVRAAHRLLLYSQQHELISSRYVSDPFAIATDLLACWEGVQATVRELYSAPMITLSLHPKFPYDQGLTTAAYRSVFTSINDARASQLPQQLDEVQAGLNLMIYDLMQSSSSSSSSGSGGMQSLMQALQQMGQQQMAMNALTQQMLQQMMESGGRLSSDARGQLQRLAAEEDRMAENLRRLMQNDPDAMKQGGSLQTTADELEAIAREMRSGRLTQDLVERQDRILSRLLDAQRSVHQREHSRERRAETGQQLEWDNPAELQRQFDEMRRRALLDDGYRAYPRAWREVIQEYLRRVNETGDGHE